VQLNEKRQLWSNVESYAQKSLEWTNCDIKELDLAKMEAEMKAFD